MTSEEIYHDEYQAAATTERLARPADERRESIIAGGKIALTLWAVVLLILYTTRAVAQIDSQAFAVLAAFGVAGVIWLAFGKRG